MMKKYEILNKLQRLNPEIAWTHLFDLGHGIFTISPENKKYYDKATGLRKLEELISYFVEKHTIKGQLKDLKVIDIGCGEGAHSIYMAKNGAIVTGIEGRALYIERAKLVIDIYNLKNISMISTDCRSLSAKDVGKFDFTLCSGLLHHLDKKSFLRFIKMLSEITLDTLLIYCHVSNPESIAKFNLKGPKYTYLWGWFYRKKYQGYLFKEHNKNDSPEVKYKKTRASLDNEESFWPTINSLLEALKDFGFHNVHIETEKHIFHDKEKISYRPLIIARKKSLFSQF